MRFLSIISAVFVCGLLYVVVFERDRLLAFAAPAAEAEAPVEGAADDTTSAADQSEAEAATQAAMAQAEAEAETDPEPDGIRRVSVVVLSSTAETVDSAVLIRGRTQAARHVDVRAETSGLVVSDPLRKGSYVEEGQLLCKIDVGTRRATWAEAEARLSEAKAKLPESRNRLPEALARVAEAEARLEEARINDTAAQKLSSDGFASQTRVAGTKAAVSSAEAALSSAKTGVESARTAVQSTQASISSAEAVLAAAMKEIERLEIRAPFAGYLESDTAELGALLQPGALCATVLQLNPMKLVGFIPETEVGRVEIGAPARARLSTGEEVTGKVSFLARSADMETRTFRVEIDVTNTNLTIRDGQTAEIAVAGAGQEAHLIPQSSMTLDDTGQLGVRYAKDGIAHFSAITILRDTREGVWVTGLPRQADVIIIGQEFVTEGVPVAASSRAELEGAGQ